MLQRVIQSGWLTLILCVLYSLIMAAFAPGFATVENASNVLVAMLPLLVVAAGQTIVLITAGIDLSVTSIIAFTSVAGSVIITSDGGILANTPYATPLAMALMIFLGSSIGFANGLCVTYLRMPPFIVTLTAMMFLSGLAVWWTQSKSIYNLPASFLYSGKNLWAALAITSLVVIGMQGMLSRTLLGMHLRAVGHNLQTARVSGVHVHGVAMVAYILSGACAAIASILITGQLETGSPVQWENNLLDVVGATVIGGTSLYGGRGNVLWTASGVMLISLIDNSLNLLNLSYFTIMMTKGGVILLAAFLDTLRHRFEGAREQ
jgi:ribose/xylose/arabinose/galactoside ABC-type transport system permease subunit